MMYTLSLDSSTLVTESGSAEGEHLHGGQTR